MADSQTYSVAALTANRSRQTEIYHDTITARSREEAVYTARESIRDQPGRTLRSPVSALPVPAGGAAAVALVVDAERRPNLYHQAFPAGAEQARAAARSEIAERYPGGAVHGLTARDAPAPTGRLDVERYAGQAVDSFKAHVMAGMDTDLARSRAVAEHASRAAATGAATWHNASKVAHAALVTYEARVEEGAPAGQARVDAVRVASGWYNDKGEPKHERGTMNVQRFASGVIDTYHTYRPHYGEERARQSTVLAAAENASAIHGVHVMRAGRIAEHSIDQYNAHRQQGASHEAARDTAAGEMAHRYDRQQDRPQERQRSRGAGMSL